MIDVLKENWTLIKETLKKEHEITEVSYKTWIWPLEVSSVKGDVVRVIFPDAAEVKPLLDYISKKYRFILQVTIEEITGFHCTVEFTTDDDEPESAQPVKNETLAELEASLNLNPKYTFDTFVVGSHNKFAHAASLAVAEYPAGRYNPLFIHGGVGLGKTHLMHSIAHFILEKDPTSKVLYVSSETFTNELIDAIRNKNNVSPSEFREKYRNIDVLLIDDIQFIIGKESTQEEFFHTFNALHENKKQIVISSDKHPKAFGGLEERLRSRFEMGLLVDISAPDYETRMAILKKKEELEGYNINDNVLDYIATNIDSNIRELEGALTKVIAYSNLYKTDINLMVAEAALKDIIFPEAEKEITIPYIMNVVAEHFGLNVDDLTSQKRQKNIVLGRQISMYLSREFTDAPLQLIGKSMGNRDHATVLHGCDKIANNILKDPSLANTVEILRKKISPV